jgi:hypothetical protein
MAALGLNSEQLATTARHPGTGLIDVLKALEVQSQKTGVPLQKLITATFGAGSVGLVSALAKQLPALQALNTSLQGASQKSLNTAFGLTQSQLSFKISQIKTQLTNALTGIGLLMLPAITDVANWITNITAYFQKHPLVQKIATDATIALFAAAVGKKLLGILGLITVGEGVAGAAGAAGATSAASAALAFLPEIAAAAVAAVIAYGIWKMIFGGGSITPIKTPSGTPVVLSPSGGGRGGNWNGLFPPKSVTPKKTTVNVTVKKK